MYATTLPILIECTPFGEVLFATFTEADARAGQAVIDKVRLLALTLRPPRCRFGRAAGNNVRYVHSRDVR